MRRYGTKISVFKHFFNSIRVLPKVHVKYFLKNYYLKESGMHLFMEDLVYGIFKNHLNSILKTKLEINIDSVSNNHYF